jgi:hypothetical protein
VITTVNVSLNGPFPVRQPSLQPGNTVRSGTGPTTFSAFLAPGIPVNGWLWAVGAVVQVPTINNATSNCRWG